MMYCTGIVWQNDFNIRLLQDVYYKGWMIMLYNLQFAFWYLFIGGLLTYLAWGFVVAFEILLAMNGSKWAIAWIRKRYRYDVLYREVMVFYPMIWLGYFFLESLPHYLFGIEKIPLDLDALFEELFNDE